LKTKPLYTFGLLCFIALTLFLTFNKHSKSGYFNYHSEIWADRAGYYIYLPTALKYNFNTDRFPDSIDAKTGNGFNIDTLNNKVITKYTYGVALMQSPFYCLADLFAKPLNQKRDGFSPIYHWSINLASVFYLVLGMFFLKKFLSTRYGSSIAILTVLVLFFATNLYYYSIAETGMSHIYSFSLFCMFLYFLQATNYLKKISFGKSFLFGILVGLIILIRPTNVIFLSACLFLDLDKKSLIINRIQRFTRLKTLIPAVIGITIIIVPQLLYWNYISGSLINYSYGKEGFNWSSPQIMSAWFSPSNGLFLYTPFYLLMLMSLFLMIRNKKRNGVYILIMFLIISYTFSAWWAWSFGCSFGSRSYIEYLAIFSIPVAYGFRELKKLNRINKASISLLIVLCIVFNLKMTYSYDGCFYGNNTWDWNAYFNLIVTP
jgi:hypothetical protein